MKIAIAIMCISFATSAGVGREYFTHSINAETEDELIEEAQRAIPLIRSGRITSVFQSHCWPNNPRTIKVKSVNVKKVYAVASDNTLTPFYTGIINYLHKRCRDD